MEPPSPFKPNLARLRQHLAEVARERNFETSPRVLSEIQSYLEEELASYGFVVRKEPFRFSGQDFDNLIASLDPNPKKPRVLIGAHFDSVSGSPGADDNASGVAALLEAARIYAQSKRQGEITIEFAGFNLEEYGMIGSQAYAEKLKREKVRFLGMISLEMVGYTSQEKGSQKMPLFLKPFYPNVGNFLGLVANTRSVKWLDQVKQIFSEVEGLPMESLALPANGWIFPEVRLSDHSPFWDHGFPALLVTDTSFFRNPHYHSAEDRIETLDLDFLAKVTEATGRLALDLASLPAV